MSEPQATAIDSTAIDPLASSIELERVRPGFHQHRSLPQAERCAELSQYNPDRTVLTGPQLAELDDLIGEFNISAAQIEGRKLVLARAWANTRRELGQFVYLPTHGAPDAPEAVQAILPSSSSGAIRVVMHEEGGLPPILVDIHRGENAELDVAQDDIARVMEQGRSAIRAFFARLPRDGHPRPKAREETQ